MMQELYTGEFVSRGDDSRWRVAIVGLSPSADAPGVVAGGDTVAGEGHELEFPDEEPLLIEWKETGKEEVLCGSTATLKILSPGDRTYESLYTIKAGSIGLRVERDGLLYWTGTLDPEFYEEPYSEMRDYEVELTFSDFGILERLKYNLEGLQAVSAIVLDALRRAGLGELVYEELISSRLPAANASGAVVGGMELRDIEVRSDNFTDEDGEVKNLKEVLEGVLQPLGLRMVQKGGKAWIYDLNALWACGESGVLRWHDDDQVLGVDKVANQVKVTFSPYASEQVEAGEVSYLGLTPTEVAGRDESYQDFRTVRRNFACWGSTNDDDLSFIVFTSGDSSDGVGATIGPNARYFKTVPLYGGEEHAGVLWALKIGNGISGNLINMGMNGSGREVVLKSYRRWLPRVSQGVEQAYLLRITLEVLFDARYNPFEDGDGDNNGSDADWMKENCGYLQVPVSVTLSDDQGTVTHHWENAGIAAAGVAGDDLGDNLGATLGQWVAGGGSGNAQYAWLEYYSAEDRNHTAACQGWQKNRQNIGFAKRDTIAKSITSLPEGQLLPYPPYGGWIEVTVYNGFRCYDYPGGGEVCRLKTDDFQEKLRWQLYKGVSIELVERGRKMEAVEVEDMEYQGYLNRDAKDAIELDTICGTMSTPVPTAKGLYFSSDTGEAIEQLTRGGRTNAVEELLIGTLHSQFADRHVRLSGTAFLLDGGLKVYTEAMQGSKKLLVVGDLQDVDAGTSELVAVELSPDEYVSNEEVA